MPSLGLHDKLLLNKRHLYQSQVLARMKRGVGKTARIYYIALAISDIGLLVWMCGISIFLTSGGLTFVTGLVSSVLILRLYF